MTHSEWVIAVETWFRSLGTRPWTTVYESGDVANVGDVLLYAWLQPDRDWEGPPTSGDWSIDSWPVLPWGWRPHFDSHESDEVPEFVVPARGPQLPLMICDEFANTDEVAWYPAEDLRLAFRLRGSPPLERYFIADDAGDEDEAIRISENKIEIATGLLVRYAAASQMDLAFAADIRCKTHRPDKLTQQPSTGRCAEDDLRTIIYPADPADDNERLAHFVGRRRIRHAGLERSRLDPFGRANVAVGFIVDQTSDGVDIEADCNDAGYGTSTTYEHLTPVYFNREVLLRYREHPTRYLIEDGQISHTSGLWWLRSVDMNNADYVVVYLGDLDALPEKEQRHWRTHNVAPRDRTPSETQLRRDILGEFTEPTSPDLLVRQLHPVVNTHWEQSFGKPLWNTPHHDDADIINQISLLVASEVSEFDTMILRLTKTFIDSLNKQALDTTSGTGSIAKLTATLESRGFVDVELLQVLRDIQGLRSKGAVHNRGSDFDFEKAGISDLKKGMHSILERLAELLRAIDRFARTTGAS